MTADFIMLMRIPPWNKYKFIITGITIIAVNSENESRVIRLFYHTFGDTHFYLYVDRTVRYNCFRYSILQTISFRQESIRLIIK